MKQSMRRTAWLSVLAAAAMPTAAVAQGLVEMRERGSFGGAVILGRPVGEFQQFVDWGGGVNLFGTIGVVPQAGLSLRLDGMFLVYGSETQSVPFSNSVPRVLLDLRTTNSIASLGLGPQFTFGRGPVTAYAYGLAGVSYFSTVTSLRGSHNGPELASTTNFDDATLAFTGGGGLRLRVSNGRKPVSLDLGMTAVQNGKTEYLRRGSILEAADGSVFIVPILSDANLMTFKLGVTASVF